MSVAADRGLCRGGHGVTGWCHLDSPFRALRPGLKVYELGRERYQARAAGSTPNFRAASRIPPYPEVPNSFDLTTTSFSTCMSRSV
jgi:hypothetical protein